MIKIKCPKCGAENSIDIFKAENGSKILCKKCNEFITIQFKEGLTPKKIKENLVKDIQKALPKSIKIKL